MAVNSLFAKITLLKKPANWTHLIRRVNFGTVRKFGRDVAQRYREGSEMLVFFKAKEAGKRYRK